MERDWLRTSWKMLVVRGVIAIVFGILAIVWPISTAIALALLWGFWALMDGIGSLAHAFQPEAKGSRLWLVFFGVIALVAAFFAIFSPAVTAVTLTWILGIWLIVRGVFEAFGAFSSHLRTPRWLLLLSAALSILLGILFAANPGAGAVGIAVWLGVTALVWGAAFVVMGLSLRREASASDQAKTVTP
ncbi:MAG TPA: HdeD family acid-resistance protein [Kribbella sp.]|uniref:HdeD family acid-resistance protein n=1 Tax=Kribbella sp. TaxID=1871183 RepID=UPI002D782B52|nr:HdeD family acid-resistance protein [Kribbella sp.]HET6293408.1 HdeD family acid-resistance protein [Kribbella sp.]